jgi:hypothetical protein
MWALHVHHIVSSVRVRYLLRISKMIGSKNKLDPIDLKDLPILRQLEIFQDRKLFEARLFGEIEYKGMQLIHFSRSSSGRL